MGKQNKARATTAEYKRKNDDITLLLSEKESLRKYNKVVSEYFEKMDRFFKKHLKISEKLL